ncbi:MAG TPA: hypothetical protein VNW51_01370, partial [Mucilaginibacter sp.]|nr:hypothetical protein [Mucilaginibacter sp.]
MREKNTDSEINRRKFIELAGVASAIGFLPQKSLAVSYQNGKDAPPPTPEHILKEYPLPVNKTAEVLENKTICVETGRFLIAGTNRLDFNGHLIAGDKVMEPNRYLGWPTILKTNAGRLFVVFSGDRDSHVCPY